MADHCHVHPVFPLELQCIILRMALENDMNDAQNLLFISKDVFDCLIPILYKVVILRQRNQLAWPPLALPIEKLPQYGRYVQHLLVTPTSVRDNGVDPYLQYCPNIINFGRQEAFLPSQLEHLVRLPLTQLRLGNPAARSLPLIPSTFILFSKITHLDIKEPDITFLSHFPSLTHLILEEDFDEDLDYEVCAEVLRQHPGLKVLIIHVPDFHTGSLPELDHEITPEMDLRVVHLNYWVIDTWRRKALGDPGNAWSVAERVVEERLARARAEAEGSSSH
ncbi:hypothetical protein BDN72DRAFT_966314 [Pluteus cervinus]|uniref:Uncharacterized protein n=1 Tax=Pluteus cervinus TaxID=181527 RepID=A0ACD2ZYC6_9AGAR|nr:hypothetical protein BDN72DRAFT_966314 [Pluteus cervinus]